MRVAELQAEVNFMKRKREAELQAETLRLEEEMEKAQARVKILEQEEDTKLSQKYKKDDKDQLRVKHESLYTNVLIGNPTNKNIIHTQDDQQLTQIRKDENIQSITTPCTDKKNTTTKSETVRLSEGIGDMLYRLVKEQSAPDVDMETFDGNPLNYTYFRCMFRETVEKKIDDPQGRLTRLIKYTSGEAQEMVKHFIHDRPDRGYQNAITLLEKNYGNPYKLLASYRNEIKRMPKIRTGDASAYRKMFNFLIKCKSLSYDEGYNPLDTPDVICMVLAKLPIYLQDRWNRDAMKIRRIRCREPGLTELLNFIEEEMMLVSDPLFSREAISQYEEKTHLSKPQKLHGNKFHSFATGRGSEDDEDQNEAAKLSCAICGEDHDIEYCDEFLNQSVQERSKIIFRRKLCYGCLTDISKDHNAKNCSNRRKCMVCNGTHPTTLHGVKIEKKRKNEQRDEDHQDITVASINTGSEVISMCIVPVKVKKDHSSEAVETYALLDSCSQGTFISEKLTQDLGASGRKTSITVKTLNGEHTSTSMVIEGLQVAQVDDTLNKWLTLPRTFAKSELPVDSDDVTNPCELKKWKYLDHIINQLKWKENPDVGLLIGANCTKALEPIEMIQSRNGGPYAFRTRLGWCVVGPVNNSNNRRISCNRITVKQADSNEVGMHYFQSNMEVKEQNVPEMLKKIYNHDFTEAQHMVNKETAGMSQEDKKFLSIVENGTKLVNGHYEIPLPFRNQDVNLPNNRIQAVKRFDSLQKRMARDKKYKDDYMKFMKDLISRGYAIETSTEPKSGKFWYLPHHGVYHPNKPGKIRVVFDLSAEYHGTSINKQLLSGPDLANQIVGVLLRFREESVAVTGDIEAMFHQVKIPEEQRNFLRFIWWKDNNPEKELVDYQMTAHVFGGISSPSCSNFALRKTASDNCHQYGQEVSNILRRNFYVDDMLKSFSSTDAAINAIHKVMDLCREGGFKLTKFSSNDVDVLKSITDEYRKDGVKDKDLQIGTLPEDKALGVKWNIQDDTLGFTIKMSKKATTRRGLLSDLSSVYDPLGFGAPFLLKGRLIIQQLCKNNINWDEPIDEHTAYEWLKWRNNLVALQDVSIPRVIKPKGFGNVTNYTLHHFSDACESGYGQSSYIRLVNDHGKVHCALLIGKSRVAPLKFISIPRLELTAATLSIKVSKMIKEELDMKIDDEIFWTDSQVVLGYINSDARRFKIFVANRVQQIRDGSRTDQWNYVETGNNPADDASRGLESKDRDRIKRWFEGPSFLWQSTPCWSKIVQKAHHLSEEDPELKKITKVNSIRMENGILSKLTTRTSSWLKLKRLFAVLLTVKDIWLKRLPKVSSFKEILQTIKVQHLEEAKYKIFMMVQVNTFANEIKHLRSKDSSHLNRSTINKLDPFIDEKGIVRVGGRLKNSNLSREENHPVILPKRNQVSEMIVRWSHQQVGHGARGMTLNHLRSSGIWIISANALVRHVIHKCVVCRKLRGKMGFQKMADLPPERCTQAPPFTYCGVDMFGPMLITERRSILKRYGALFTCFASRAVHIEVTNAIDADSFILSLRRFMARRGAVRSIWSDNGTNFVGTNNEMKKAFKEMDHKKIKIFLQEKGADWLEWHHNPPAASHMGGVWERQIRSARRILEGLMRTHGQSLNDESLRTLMTEVEMIVNSRPLTVENLNDISSNMPLSPSNLLTMKTNVVMPPPGNFMKPDLYSKKRWRRVQHIAEEFWNRWRKEFLQSLQERQKWNTKTRNFEVGDIVLLQDDSHRNQWPMARIVGIEPDKHGNVRSVELQVADRNGDGQQILRRPITKIILLVENELVRIPTEGANQDVFQDDDTQP